MNAGQQSARRIASQNALSRDTVCISCRHRLASHASRRHASAATAAVAEEPPRTQTNPSNPPVTATGPKKAFQLKCSPVLSRPPVITRELTSFEKAFFLYQKRLNERLALPFTRYFYTKKETPGDIEWKRKRSLRRGTAARDIGAYNAYDDEKWNDEVLVGSKLGDPEDITERLILDAEGKDITEGEPQGDAETGGETISGDARAGEGSQKPVAEVNVERPASRITEADEQNDVKSLNRKLDRSLYLLVQNKDGQWRFPEDRVYGRENLHQAAERILLQAGGINMNTWVLANHPIGHYVNAFKSPILSKILPNRLVRTSRELEQEEYGEKVFFLKSRILAGQADLSQNEYKDKDFSWLAKEEVEKVVSKHYWSQIRNMLTER
ncbi:hypothetical protein PRZ48_005922 [Zasmidium cellare]|uniref:Large ribosomal subunit protein mL46 n=1 Tax=Zasmidium cellare TaxID=395010 RepID=A0ABR0ELX3_ZASCE|nr:hypothetical protein PRZ48_005922 [Zasmidium cellare]